MQPLAKEIKLITTNKHTKIKQLVTHLKPDNRRQTFSFTALLLMILLLSSSFASVFNNIPFSASAADPDFYVNNQADLRDKIANAPDGINTIIAFTGDIQLASTPLTIPAGKDITLVSDDDNALWKLIGVSGQNTITVNGVLTLNGINVTHATSTTTVAQLKHLILNI
jgi:hypothetical protein